MARAPEAVLATTHIAAHAAAVPRPRSRCGSTVQYVGLPLTGRLCGLASGKSAGKVGLEVDQVVGFEFRLQVCGCSSVCVVVGVGGVRGGPCAGVVCGGCR